MSRKDQHTRGASDGAGPSDLCGNNTNESKFTISRFYRKKASQQHVLYVSDSEASDIDDPQSIIDVSDSATITVHPMGEDSAAVSDKK